MGSLGPTKLNRQMSFEKACYDVPASQIASFKSCTDAPTSTATEHRCPEAPLTATCMAVILKLPLRVGTTCDGSSCNGCFACCTRGKPKTRYVPTRSSTCYVDGAAAPPCTRGVGHGTDIHIQTHPELSPQRQKVRAKQGVQFGRCLEPNCESWHVWIVPSRTRGTNVAVVVFSKDVQCGIILILPLRATQAREGRHQGHSKPPFRKQIGP